MLRSLLEFIGTVWEVFWRALVLDPTLLEVAQTVPVGDAFWVVLTIVLLAGASQLLGQSVVLFLNKVKPARFLFSLLLNGLIFGISLLVWALVIWAIGWFFGRSEPFFLVLRMVLLGSAPYILGFLVLVPYAGTFIGRVIAVWSFLVTLGMLRYTYQTELWRAVVLVGLGWLLVMALTATIGRPVVALRNRLFLTVVGSSLDASAYEILTAYAAGGIQPAGRGKE